MKWTKCGPKSPDPKARILGGGWGPGAGFKNSKDSRGSQPLDEGDAC